MKKIIKTENAPAAIGPYSQAVMANGMLYMSGQIALIPETAPARSCVQVAGLPKGVKVEIEAIAVCK